MSRLAKRAIVVPKGVEVKLDNRKLLCKGPKGNLSLELMDGIEVKIDENGVLVTKTEKLLKHSFLGLYWALINNLINGVFQGFEKRLTLIGVGFRAQVKGNKIDLSVGYSHPTALEIPKDIQVKVDKSTEIIITGADKQKVGQFAASIRDVRPPEPYKGKGIRYKDEYVRKKAGKAAKAKA